MYLCNAYNHSLRACDQSPRHINAHESSSSLQSFQLPLEYDDSTAAVVLDWLNWPESMAWHGKPTCTDKFAHLENFRSADRHDLTIPLAPLHFFFSDRFCSLGMLLSWHRQHTYTMQEISAWGHFGVNMMIARQLTPPKLGPSQSHHFCVCSLSRCQYTLTWCISNLNQQGWWFHVHLTIKLKWSYHSK